MKLIQKYNIFINAMNEDNVFKAPIEKEKTDTVKPRKYNNKSLVNEVCTALILINNSFLDNILDKGMISRYSEDSQAFLTDLKTLILKDNNLKLGKFLNHKCVEDVETYKVNKAFENLKFSIEKDWNKLVNSRITARNIIDKMFIDGKLNSDDIQTIYWTSPNKDKNHDEDLVIEMKDGNQYNFVLDKSFSVPKTASYSKILEDMIGDSSDKLYNSDYLVKWNKLTQRWVRIIYDNSYPTIKKHIEKFISPDRIDNLKYLEYFDIRHSDEKYQYLGEHIPELNKNILKFSDLMNEIWKNKDICVKDSDYVYEEWKKVRIFLLNAKILENLLTNSILENVKNTVTKSEDDFKKAEGELKLRLIKLIVDKIGSEESDDLFYLSRNGNQFHKVPKRKFFRDNIDDFEVFFDYHVDMVVDKTNDENNDFNIYLKLNYKDSLLLKGHLIVKFTGGEFNDRLSAKYKFEAVSRFNEIVTKIEQ